MEISNRSRAEATYKRKLLTVKTAAISRHSTPNQWRILAAVAARWLRLQGLTRDFDKNEEMAQCRRTEVKGDLIVCQKKILVSLQELSASLGLGEHIHIHTRTTYACPNKAQKVTSL